MPDAGGLDREPPILEPIHEDVYFFRRARISLGDLWTEAADWAPTVATAAFVVLLPYLMARFLDPESRPALFSGALLTLLWRDRVVRGVALVAFLTVAALWLYKVTQLILERRRRVVRMDLHEIECWPERTARFLLVRDVVGAQVGRTEQRSRWWVLRAPRSQVVLFVKRPGDETIERLRFDFSRHELVTEAHGGGLVEVSQGDGNRAAADVIALLRRRRMTLSLPLEELPEVDVDVTGELGVRLVGNRDLMVLHTPKGELTIPGWAVRSAQVIASGKESRAPLQLALELDPRCGEFHLLIGLGKGPGDEQIVQWCQLLAARFDKDPAGPRSRP